MSQSINKVAVIGAGTMGHGIAQVSALAGYEVTITDLDDSAIQLAMEKVRKNLDGGIARGKLTEEARDGALARLSAVDDLESAVQDADLCIEAIVENKEIKQKLFADMELWAGGSAILASNTSSVPIGMIAEATAHPERVIGMHFFNPVHIMKLVELVVHEGTSEETRLSVIGMVEALGKESIVVKDSPGFATSRLGVVLGLEAIRMLEQGVASAEDIDKAMALGYKHPMGPLRLTDLVGLDVRLAIAKTLSEELGGDQYEPPALLSEKVARGELGRKSGRGFYDWNE